MDSPVGSPGLYNNVIAANEENWYKIAGSTSRSRRACREGATHTRGASRRPGLPWPMAAATSAAISMEMRWMSAISYDKISAQKRRSRAKRGPPRYSAATQTAPPENLHSLSFSLSLFCCAHRLYRSNGYQSLAGEKRAETCRPSNAIFIYRGPEVTTRERTRNINRLPGSINPDRCSSRVVDWTVTRTNLQLFRRPLGPIAAAVSSDPVLIRIRGKSKVAADRIFSRNTCTSCTKQWRCGLSKTCEWISFKLIMSLVMDRRYFIRL